MRIVKWLLAPALLAALGTVAGAADAKPKRLLLVTHSGGFMHDSIGVAEQILKEIGPKNGFEVTCWRFTADPDAKVKIKEKVNGQDVEREVPALQAYSEQYRRTTGEKGKPGEEVTKEQCGRINASTLKNFDIVLMFTTGKKGDRYGPPMTDEEEKDLGDWVKAGGAFAGTHCATDTLYTTPYGELIGGLFKTHPAQQKVRLKVEDPKHPAAKGFKDGDEYYDEWYIFRDEPYSRDRLHIILSMYPDSFKPNAKTERKDNDYAIAWCHEVGKGKVFYTSMGHRRETWRDPRFQESLIGGLKWALGQAEGDATPSSKLAGKAK
jgi:type 1 glutamine amidotransferase